MKKKIDPQDQELIDSLVNKKFPRYSKIRYFFEYSVPGTRSWTHINTLKNRVLLDEGKAYEKKLKKKPLRELLKLQKKETSKVTKPMNPKMEWIPFANQIGRELAREHPLLSNEQIVKKVRERMEKEGITGRGDRIPSDGTISGWGFKGIRS
jgi:hypothetical protein